MIFFSHLTSVKSRQKVYDTVKGKFDSHFVKHRNVIFEHVKFNRRVQQEGEPVDDFIIDLYSLAEHCDYGQLHDQMELSLVSETASCQKNCR